MNYRLAVAGGVAGSVAIVLVLLGTIAARSVEESRQDRQASEAAKRVMRYDPKAVSFVGDGK